MPHDTAPRARLSTSADTPDFIAAARSTAINRDSGVGIRASATGLGVAGFDVGAPVRPAVLAPSGTAMKQTSIANATVSTILLISFCKSLRSPAGSPYYG